LKEENMEKIPDKITIGDKYKPAMEMINPKEATDYFELCVEHTMRFGKSRKEAESIERQNFGYFAGYYDQETRLRVERLFNCVHPIFGAVAEHIPTSEEAFELGKELGEKISGV
jgi:hypothetical protein